MTRILILSAAAVLVAGVVHADSTAVWEGGVRVGGIIKDETGDQSVMPETFNVYEGFALSSIRLKGRFDPQTHLQFHVDDLNLDDRRGELDFRRSSLVGLRMRYDESRFVFDPDGMVDAARRDFWSRLSITPWRSLWFSADYGLQTREGERLGFPAGVSSALGTRYDSDFHRYRVEAQARAPNGIGGTLAFDGVTTTDRVSSLHERDGYVVSANVHLPGLIYDRLTHVMRGSLGRSELRTSDLGYDLGSFQYTGVIAPWPTLRAKYRFYSARVDDEATRIRTDRYINDGDVEWHYRIATFSGGYGWEAWDDDRSVTTYHNYRAAVELREPRDRVSGRFAWSTRNKEDEEDITLLRDTEYSRWDARVDARPVEGLSAGGRVADRTRDMPGVEAKVEGLYLSAYGRYDHHFTGDSRVENVRADLSYQHSDDDYDDAVGEYHVTSDVVTGQVHADLIYRVTAGAGVTYVSIGDDLDIDKSILSFELGYELPQGFSIDAKYNVYNYDDYLVFGRYYTANVVWLNIGYNFAGE
jgi:hypothetical protein